MPALIFDCDGVLADTERDGHLPAFNAAFAEFGLPISWGDAKYAEQLKIGGGKERIASEFTPALVSEAGLSPDPEEQAALIKRVHARKTELFTERVEAGMLPARPGITRLIGEALDAGWTVAVASTSAEKSVRAVLLNAMGERWYEQVHVFAGDIVPRKKPAPDIYLKVLADLALDPADCVVVEDSGIGVDAAASAGLTVLVTVSSYTAADDFSRAAVVLPSLGDPGRPFAGSPLRKPPTFAEQGFVSLSDIAQLIHH
ncbi:MAG: HAD-IA family hydrolase [Actinobacteria bacterium]|nr:HAD-IA family hydrolase [Actinomycetota bacterium]